MEDAPIFARDMDLVREILQWAEKGGWHRDAPTVDELKLTYHVKIMVDGGLIDGTGEMHRTVGPGSKWQSKFMIVKGLTWKGHEFLEATRSDTVWKKAKETFTKNGVPFVSEILLSVVKATISQHTGMPLP